MYSSEIVPNKIKFKAVLTCLVRFFYRPVLTFNKIDIYHRYGLGAALHIPAYVFVKFYIEAGDECHKQNCQRQ